MTNVPNLNKIDSFDDETVIFKYEKPTKRDNTYQSEYQMEMQLIEQLTSQGYEYLKDVKDEQSLIINLRKQIEILNNYQFSENEWNQFFNNFLANQQDSITEKTNKIQNDFIYPLNCDNGQIKNINIIDKKNVHNNKLQVINQYVNDQGKYDNRYDVTILVNGIPMVHIELKRRGIALKEAFNQINRYKHESYSSSSGLFDFIQIFIISNGTNTKYYANTTRYLHVKNLKKQNIKSKTSYSFEFTNYWSDAQNQIIQDIEDFSKTFLSKKTILNVLIKYCIFTSEKTLLVMRPYQIVATERILKKINDTYNHSKKLGTIEAGGYIWHATGSGKTVTSFKTAQLATQLGYIDKVLFVVDRKDLDYQTMKEYDRFEKGAANSNTSTAILEKQLHDDSAKIIITTIQKLSNFIKKNDNNLIYQKHFVIIFDECHRSQFGDMHHSITSHFKKYNIFGFTGTPIFAQNTFIDTKNPKDILQSVNAGNIFKTTEQLFGSCLHTYTIANAIEDENVLPFKYDECKTFAAKEDIRDDLVININKEDVWLVPQRIKDVSKYILDHFYQVTYRNEAYEYKKIINTMEIVKDKKNQIKPERKTFNIKGFNSIFAVSSIEAAKLYYTELKQQLSQRTDVDLKIAIIYSFNPNEKISDIDNGILEDENNESISQLDQSSRDFLDGAIQDYNEMFKTNFDSNGDNFQNYYKDISMRLKNKEIDLLIVVNMFLTGFDATTLNTLWVDKWLKMHGLIQAFSRTNRILNSIKKFGYICSFRPLEKSFNEAISLFSDENARGIILIKSFDDYYNGYKNSSGVFEPGYKQLTTNLFNRFPLNSHISKQKDQIDFIKLFNRILKIRNILISFDEFEQQEIFSERDLQDYVGLYQDIYDKLKEHEKINKVDITNDLNFEIELLKQIDFNIDYIFNLVKQKKNEHIENKELISFITKTLESSYQLRSKKQLIIDFINSLEHETDKNVIENENYLINKFNEYKKVRMDKDLSVIIRKFNLNENETKKYMNDSFENGELKTFGINIEKILPKITRFGGIENERWKIKNNVINELEDYFNNYFSI